MEGRDAVHELRSMGPITGDLAQSIKKLCRRELLGNLSSENPPELRVEVEGFTEGPESCGARRSLPDCGRGALRNAIQHAGAQRIEEWRFVTIRSNWRYKFAMMERVSTRALSISNTHPVTGACVACVNRTKLIGGSFEIWSKPGSGTEIELKIPASAYAKPSAARWTLSSREPRAS